MTSSERWYYGYSAFLAVAVMLLWDTVTDDLLWEGAAIYCAGTVFGLYIEARRSRTNKQVGS